VKTILPIIIVALIITFLTVAATSFAQSKESTPYSIIAIEYAGLAQDAPFTSVLISDSEAGAKWYRPRVLNHELFFGVDVHVVNSSFLKILVATVDALENSRQKYAKDTATSEAIHAIAPIRVSVVTPKRNSSFLYDAKEALPFLDIMRNACSKDESLSGGIAQFRDRILPFNMRIQETTAKVREAKPGKERDGTAARLSGVTHEIVSSAVSDKTIADIVSLLDVPDKSVQLWAARALIPFGPRAKAAAPKLLPLLREEDCEVILKGGGYYYNALVLGTTIRPMFERMGIEPPPIPSLEDCQKPQ